MPNSPLDTFAQRLRILRIERRISIAKLARLVGVSKVTIWHWERGENTPRAAKMKTLADALGVSPEYLELGSLDEPVICDAPQAGPQLLSDILDHVKRYIAQATGIDSDQITIMIDY